MSNQLDLHPDILVNSEARRDWEVFESVVREWPEWQECQHGKRCVDVMAHWSDDAPFTVTTGRVNHTQRFTRTVHLDGTATYDPDGKVATFEYGVHNRCPKCGTVDSLSTKQEAYCDRTSCSTEGCTYESVYMIGD